MLLRAYKKLATLAKELGGLRLAGKRLILSFFSVFNFVPCELCVYIIHS